MRCGGRGVTILTAAFVQYGLFIDMMKRFILCWETADPYSMTKEDQ